MIIDFHLIIGVRRCGKLIRVLIFGKNGMLGSTIYRYFSENSQFEVKGTERSEFDVDKFMAAPGKYNLILDFDYIINYIGIIKPYCRDDDSVGIRKAIKIN